MYLYRVQHPIKQQYLTRTRPEVRQLSMEERRAAATAKGFKKAHQSYSFGSLLACTVRPSLLWIPHYMDGLDLFHLKCMLINLGIVNTYIFWTQTLNFWYKPLTSHLYKIMDSIIIKQYPMVFRRYFSCQSNFLVGTNSATIAMHRKLSRPPQIKENLEPIFNQLHIYFSTKKCRFFKTRFLKKDTKLKKLLKLCSVKKSKT